VQQFLKNKFMNRWRLFWLVSAAISAIMVYELMGVDLSTGPGVSEMIGFSVRFAVPIIFIVVGTSSLQFLFPGAFSIWLLRNRKYIGLCFAVAMAWQGLFIAMMSLFHRDYYYEEIYLLRDELEGSVGYIFLSAMVLTSFQFTRKHLTPPQWKLIHKTGLYFLWAYPFSVYWWNLSYYGNPQIIDYVFYLMGFTAFTLRIAAWGKKRRLAALRENAAATTSAGLLLLGGVVIAFGLFAAWSGVYWQSAMTTFLTSPQWSANLLLWLPYWPLEPFLPLFAIGVGTMLLTTRKA